MSDNKEEQREDLKSEFYKALFGIGKTLAETKTAKIRLSSSDFVQFAHVCMLGEIPYYASRLYAYLKKFDMQDQDLEEYLYALYLAKLNVSRLQELLKDNFRDADSEVYEECNSSLKELMDTIIEVLPIFEGLLTDEQEELETIYNIYEKHLDPKGTGQINIDLVSDGQTVTKRVRSRVAYCGKAYWEVEVPNKVPYDRSFYYLSSEGISSVDYVLLFKLVNKLNVRDRLKMSENEKIAIADKETREGIVELNKLQVQLFNRCEKACDPTNSGLIKFKHPQDENVEITMKIICRVSYLGEAYFGVQSIKTGSRTFMHISESGELSTVEDQDTVTLLSVKSALQIKMQE